MKSKWILAIATALGFLLLLSDRVSAQQPIPDEILAQAAALPYVPGTLLPYAGADTEQVRRWLFSRGWLIANGAELKEEDFRLLWLFIRDKYGAARDGVFNIPDLRGRVTLGAGQGPDLTERILGSRVGAEEHTLGSIGIGAGDHPCRDGGCNHARATDLNRKINVVQPSLVVNFLIYFGRSTVPFEALTTVGDKK